MIQESTVVCRPPLGTVAGLTVVSGTHAPVSSPGIETFENVSYQVPGGIGPLVQWEIVDTSVMQGAPARQRARW